MRPSAETERRASGPSGPSIGDQHRRFNDKFRDDATSLSYYGVRYYDGQLLGWTQVDPMFRFAPDAAWGAWGRAAAGHLYVFTLAAPTRYLDPNGLDPVLNWIDRKVSRLVDKAVEVATSPNAAASIVFYETNVAVYLTGEALSEGVSAITGDQSAASAGRHILANALHVAADAAGALGDAVDAAADWVDDRDDGQASGSAVGPSPPGSTIGSVPKAPRGKGSVAKEKRDPKRRFTKE